MTSSLRAIFALSVVVLFVSCSSDAVKRNTYHSLQTMKQRECQQQPGNQDCPQPPSYNQYEKQREQELKQ